MKDFKMMDALRVSDELIDAGKPYLFKKNPDGEFTEFINSKFIESDLPNLKRALVFGASNYETFEEELARTIVVSKFIMAVVDYLYMEVDGQPMMRSPENDEEEYYYDITVLLDKENGLRLDAYTNYRKRMLQDALYNSSPIPTLKEKQ